MKKLLLPLGISILVLGTAGAAGPSDKDLSRVKGLLDSLNSVEKQDSLRSRTSAYQSLPGPFHPGKKSVEPLRRENTNSQKRFRAPMIPDSMIEKYDHVPTRKNTKTSDQSFSEMPEYLRLNQKKPLSIVTEARPNGFSIPESFQENEPVPVEQSSVIKSPVHAVDQTKPSEGIENVYTVQPGDSLRQIARKLYRNPDIYTQIMEWNNLKTPNLQPNQKLVLKMPVIQGQEVLKAQQLSVDELFPSDRYLYKVHKVHPGESLARITKKYLGTGNAFLQVARLNQIDPNKFLYVGQKLIVPVPR